MAKKKHNKKNVSFEFYCVWLMNVFFCVFFTLIIIIIMIKQKKKLNEILQNGNAR